MKEISSKSSKLERIAEFFKDSDTPWKGSGRTSIEESPVAPLIRMSGSFYYCILHTRFKNVHIESIEHHIRYEDLEGHWYALEKAVSEKLEGDTP